MDAVVTVLHVIVCIFLVAVVLLQRGKGAQVGAVFGGGAGATMFGSRGAGNFLTKLTAGAAAVYMITSLALSYSGITGAGERLFEEGSPAAEAPAEGSLFEEIETVPAEEPTGAAADETAEPTGAAADETAEPTGAAADETAEPTGDAASEPAPQASADDATTPDE